MLRRAVQGSSSRGGANRADEGAGRKAQQRTVSTRQCRSRVVATSMIAPYTRCKSASSQTTGATPKCRRARSTSCATKELSTRATLRGARCCAGCASALWCTPRISERGERGKAIRRALALVAGAAFELRSARYAGDIPLLTHSHQTRCKQKKRGSAFSLPSTPRHLRLQLGWRHRASTPSLLRLRAERQWQLRGGLSLFTRLNLGTLSLVQARFGKFLQEAAQAGAHARP